MSRVDVSTDLGVTWHVAQLLDPVESKGPNRQWGIMIILQLLQLVLEIDNNLSYF